MRRASDGSDGWVTAAVLLAVGAIGMFIPPPATAFALGLLVAFGISRLARLYHASPMRAWAAGGLACSAAAAIGALFSGELTMLTLLGAGTVAAAWLSDWSLRDNALHAKAARRTALLVTASLLAGSAAIVAVTRPQAERLEQPAEERTTDFVPLALDAGGTRLVLFSIRDTDTPTDDDTFSLWSLTVADGTVRRIFRGYPFLTTDWCPAGNQLTFCASDAPTDGTAPLSLYAGGFDGSNVRRRLAAPQDGGSWLYPLWSRQDDLLGVWLLPENPALPISHPQLSVPRSYAVPADQGNAVELVVRGSRLNLMSAWSAEGLGVYMVTENGVYVLDAKSGRSRRIVPSGEAPLDPFPFVTSEGVSSNGRDVAYLEVTFKKGEFERVDLGVTTNDGRPRRVVKDIIPVAYGWSADGRTLVTAQNNRGKLVLDVFDAETRAVRRVPTAQKVAVKQPLAQVMVSRDGKYASVDGLLDSEDSWTLNIIDLKTGNQTSVLHNIALACGFNAANKLLIADLRHVGEITPETGVIKPIYPIETSPGFTGASAGALRDAVLLRQRDNRQRMRLAAEALNAIR